MTREDAATIFERIALLLELKGENTFKVRAYRTGAEIVESFSGDIMQMAAENQLAGIKGLGEALRDKLHEMATTGKLEFYEKLKAEFPDTLFDLFDVPGLGPKKVAALHIELGVSSIADLKRACESGEAAKLSGFGGKTVEKILDGIAFREQHAAEFRQDQVHALAQEILEALRQHPHVSHAEVCGSFRRGKETVHDLDFLVSTKHPEEVIDSFVQLPIVVDVIAKGPTKASVHATHGVQCDLRAVSRKEFPFALVYFTGSKEHNVVIRQRALARGWSLNEYAFTPVPDHADAPVIPPVHDEAELYRALDLDFIDPELRENKGEIEAAEHGGLPHLVQLENLRGVFHNHTTASDGGATLREMAHAAHELGLQYLGIADHSKSSFQANGLNEQRLLAQIEEIQALNEEMKEEGFRIFTGSEVDILKDGSLDFSDEIMSRLDYVVASVHNVFNLPEAEMTKRIIRAIENPNVTMLGHLTGRLLLQRPAYNVNIAAVIDAAAETGTIIELNASAWRLDMDWRWWKLAKEKGVKCSINPDAHSTHGLQAVIYGIKAARKGWLTRKDIINCLPLGQIEEALRAKRAR
ncbi:DNA polymerase/3'-5' exonuclease PolX [Prosthecobacter vanneervenii]|uniref:DNA polymerase beta n=1 Tax=Prosthecobacter vanneervenii TaxID=48466 RepID=A0A7W7YCF1_9BACT|nr:DNA polymerase/3'-5' exonuclease PolX [Prosthecobacter vanneervenii]MBB5033637.1 DNA polymerase (family 10) [Prosthecobacter vanneervenii]